MESIWKLSDIAKPYRCFLPKKTFRMFGWFFFEHCNEAEFLGPLSRWAHDSKTAPRFIKYNLLQLSCRGSGVGPESQIWSVCLQVMHDNNNNNNNNDVCNTNMCKATMLKKTCNSSYTHKKEGSHIPLKGLLVKIKSSEIGYITSQEGIFPKTRFIWLLFHGVTHGRSMTNSTDPRQHLRLWAVRNTVHPQEFEI